MGLIESAKLLFRVRSTVADVEQGVKMKDSTRIVVAVFGLLTLIVQNEDVQKAILHFLIAHPAVALTIGGISSILTLIHVPVSAVKKVAPVLLIALLLAAPGAMRAQNAALPVPPITSQQFAVPIDNLYAAGVSYNVGGSPAIAGTGLYARRVSDSGTYAFTAVDALPNTVRPFTVSTNIGVGVAQKIVTLGKVPIYVPTAVGVSWNGPNAGWQWNGGAIAPIRIKGSYYVVPTVRFLKSSVSNGSGYQPIVGVLLGWGQ